MESVRILLVDDDAALVKLLQRYLDRMGFQVEAVSDSRLALQLFQAAPERFDLVVADMTMPGVSGEELLREIFASDPKVRAILCSGYPMAGSALERDYPGRLEFLQKPFVSAMLADAIRRLLGKRGAHPASSSAP